MVDILAFAINRINYFGSNLKKKNKFDHLIFERMTISESICTRKKVIDNLKIQDTCLPPNWILSFAKYGLNNSASNT